MKRWEKKEKFLEKVGIPLLLEELDALEERLQKEKDILLEQLVREMEGLLEGVVMWQKNGGYPLGYLIIHVMRQDLRERKYQYQLYGYDKTWYYHGGKALGTWDSSVVFQYFERFRQKFLREGKKYQLTEVELEQMALEYVEEFHGYVTELLRFGANFFTATKAYQEIEKEAVFEIQCGEYYEPCDCIYQEGAIFSLEEWREELLQGKQGFSFADMRSITVEQEVLCQKDLRYVDFREGNFTGTTFEQCFLIGTRFQNSVLRNACFKNCILSNCSFAQCDLRGAKFYHCMATVGTQIGIAFLQNSFFKVDFRKSDMRGVFLEHSLFEGADWRKAEVTGVDFTKCQLFLPLFSEEQLEQGKFTEEQKKYFDRNGKKTVENLRK